VTRSPTLTRREVNRPPFANPRFSLAAADTAPLELTWSVIVARSTRAVLPSDVRPLVHAPRTSGRKTALAVTRQPRAAMLPPIAPR
ncbi:MAG TPA: hypothetical protein VN609_02700, partial [Propionibacteriaceae bacterium]|nr:hypothetical protein [Propionibacteriaceae bacterium]